MYSCAVVPRRPRICGRYAFVSCNSRLESDKEEKKKVWVEGVDIVVSAGESQAHVRKQVQHLLFRGFGLVRVWGSEFKVQALRLRVKG